MVYGVDVDFRGRGRLERCELWGNADGGVRVQALGDLYLAACTIRDHAAGRATGVYVRTGGAATVGADCVFARNAGGDVVRVPVAAAKEEEEEEEEGEGWDEV